MDNISKNLDNRSKNLVYTNKDLFNNNFMGKAKLRKKLEGLSKENIIRVVMTLYDATSKEARHYLDFYAEPNSKDECEHFKHIIRQEFFPTRGLPKDPSFATCRKAISDFKKMKPLPYDLADLMLFYIETGCEHTMTFGDMWEQYYTALENNFDKAMKCIVEFGLLETFEPRIKRMLNATDCGWGFSDTLWDIYHKHCD